MQLMPLLGHRLEGVNARKLALAFRGGSFFGGVGACLQFLKRRIALLRAAVSPIFG